MEMTQLTEEKTFKTRPNLHFYWKILKSEHVIKLHKNINKKISNLTKSKNKTQH